MAAAGICWGVVVLGMVASVCGVEPHNPLQNGVSSKWQGLQTGTQGNRQAEASPPLPLIGDAMAWTKKYRLVAVVRRV